MISVETHYDPVTKTGIVSPKEKISFENTADLRNVLRDFMGEAPGIKKLIVNLESVSFIDSSGLGLIIAAKNSFLKLECTCFIVCCIKSPVKKVMDQTNLTAYFITTDTFEEAFDFLII